MNRTIQQNARIVQACRALRGNRDQMTRAIHAVRSSLEETHQNAVLQIVGAESSAIIQGLTTWATEPVVQGVDAQGRHTLTFTEITTWLEDPQDPLTEVTSTVERVIWTDPSGQFVYADVAGYSATGITHERYMHTGTDSPTIREFVSILYAMYTYAHYNGELPAEVIQHLFGIEPAATSALAGLLDIWK
jgi:hypothetical protein